MIGRFSRNGEVLVEGSEVTIALDDRRKEGPAAWYGEAWVPTQITVIPGDRLTLTLAGEHREILVNRVTVDSRASRMLVRFVGNGPLPGPPDPASSAGS